MKRKRVRDKAHLSYFMKRFDLNNQLEFVTNTNSFAHLY